MIHKNYSLDDTNIKKDNEENLGVIKMMKFIEVDIAETNSKTLVNVCQIVNIGEHHSSGNGYISFNSSDGGNENFIQTKQNYAELKRMILDL